ncbi:MAG: tripartite tricarboxylate transporter substrate binding protein [Herbinix sp.]|nr:tripartite tricarboxylate transporter substrate binding protein [Herbinix sp.]
MKKLVSILLVLTMVIALAGCSSTKEKEPSTQTTEQAKETETVKSLDFPKNPITIICPWAAGGSSDSMVRAIAEIGKEYFGVAVNVVNKDGAGGTIATTEFKNTKADGYTICLEAVGVFTTQPFMREVQYSMDDFKPVIGLTTEPIIMVAGKQSGITSIDDMKALGRSISYGFSGTGSLPQLAQEKFFQDSGLEAEGVPFEGSAPTLTALLGSHIDIGAAHPGEILQYVESGDLIPIGVFSQERDSREAFKNIPTFKELGYDIDMSVWKFLIIPKDVPDEVSAYLTETMGKIIADEKFIEFANNSNLMITPYTPEEVIQKVADEAAVNKELLAK